MTTDESTHPIDELSAPKVAPTLQLSQRGLVISLLAMAGVGMAVYAMFPDSVGGPALPVEVELDMQPVPIEDGGGALMTEVVVLRSLADHPIGRLSIDINGQYLLFRDSPLKSGETIVLPQRIFTDKRSSQRFNPSKYRVEDVTVRGQLPSGARGLSHFEFQAGDEASVESGELQ